MGRSNIQIETAVSLQSITKIYQDHPVLQNISFDIAAGEFLSLLGPSGSGKTTLLRMIAGLVTPDQGKIILKGQDVSFTPPNKRNLGMVFQQYALFPHMTVWENVAFGLTVRKMEREAAGKQVQKYLELMGLTPLAARKPRELSGGQQQRVSLARALAVEPVLLLFDEPLSNLDARLKEQLLQEIRNLHKSLGFTAVYVTHDQNEALYLSDNIAVLNQGRIEQLSTPLDIISRPASLFVADFCGYTNRVEGAVLESGQQARLGGLQIPVGHLGAGCRPGDRGVIMMRPNAVRIHDQSDRYCSPPNGHGQLVVARVNDCRYLGGQTELKLSLEQDLEITAVSPAMLKPLPEAGAGITISFAADSIAFYQPEPADRANIISLSAAGERADALTGEKGVIFP
ncbi:ABC transporter ATP-binding protein [Sporomusa sp.]|uniref:ABC transporter ATP-binding protein n=1 Tax=Sporomusa sp. TaxID=2078658 RepID=UPI002B54811E|nr:ABC transporter ATP-binding protein [Sporomusa sp.]HWR05871.1 ABC transporter ATP-binding protein [Sporomusa sp.]